MKCHIDSLLLTGFYTILYCNSVHPLRIHYHEPNKANHLPSSPTPPLPAVHFRLVLTDIYFAAHHTVTEQL